MRNTLFFLLGAIGLACERDTFSPEIKEPVSVEQKITTQQQEKINKINRWYERAKQDGIFNYSELQDLEGIAETPPGNIEKSKYKAVSLAELAAARPYGDVNRDGKVDIFDLLALLQVLGGRIASSEASDVNKNGKTDIFDLIDILRLLSGYYDNAPGINASFNGNRINAADSLNAYNQALIQISYFNSLDSAFVNVNNEGKGDLRSINLNLGLYRISVKAFGNDKESSLEFVVNVLAQNVTTKPISNISFNEDEVSSNIIDADDYFTANGISISNYTAEGFNNVSVSIATDGKVSVSNKTKDFNGTEAGKLRAHYGKNYVDNPLTVVVNPMDDLRGQHKDNDTEKEVKANLTIDNVFYETDASGNFDVQIAPGIHTIKAKQVDGSGNATGYIRTVSINGEDNNLTIYSVSYPTSVSAQTFVDFIWEGNAYGYPNDPNTTSGIIKFFNDLSKYVIMIKSLIGDLYNLTNVGMDVTESIIKEKIFGTFGFEIPIEKKDANYTIPPEDQRKGTIYGYGYDAWAVSPIFDKNVMVIGYSKLNAYHVNNSYADYITGIIQECASPIFMPYEIEFSVKPDKSAFHRFTWLTEFTEIDKKAYKLCRRYRQENINDVLGL